MSTEYRLLKIDAQALNGGRFEWHANEQLITLIPLKAGELPIIIARAIKPKAPRNGQPKEVTATVVDPSEVGGRA